MYFAQAKAYHKGGGTTEQVKAHRLYYYLHSQLIYGKKHFSKLAMVLLVLITLILDPLVRGVYTLFVQRSTSQFREAIRGYGMLYTSLKPKRVRR
jgi:GT2 family glycosyltransferase